MNGAGRRWPTNSVKREGERSRGRARAGRRRAVRQAVLVFLLCCVAAVVVYPFDGAAAGAAGSVWAALGGDVKRELEAAQQYGQFTCTVVLMLAVWLLDPGRRRRLLDWLAGAALAGLIAFPMKVLFGRPRPRFEDPGVILGPFGRYPIDGSSGQAESVHHAWELWAGISSDLWSMPSTHTAFAAVSSAVLAVLYPRVRPLAIGLVVLVGATRVLSGAHYPADVLVGGGLGWACGTVAASRLWGVRGLDAVWGRVVDRGARPAFPGVLRRERRRSAG